MRLPRLDLAAALNRTFLYSLMVTALLAAKLLHVFSHLPTTAVLLFILYFPTFLTPDLFVIFASRLIFQRSRICSFLLCSLITLGAAAQIGLFMETGGELRWGMAGKVFREPRGFVGMLMTGLMPTLVIISVFACAAFFLTPALYNASSSIIESCLATLFPTRCQKAHRQQEYSLLSPDEEEGIEKEGIKKEERRSFFGLTWARVKLFTAVGVLLVLHIVRPPTPFNHMSTTLPFTMLDVIFDHRSPMCDPSPWDGPRHFPFPNLIRENLWMLPSQDAGGNSRGWKPGSRWWEMRREKPSWLPKEEAPGFAKWYRGSSFQLPPDHEKGDLWPRHEHGDEHGYGHGPPPGFGGEHHHPPHHHPPHPRPRPPGYESVLDPLKVSNFDQPLLDTLREALGSKKGGPDIKHVVMMTLESTRKDVFPLVKDSRLFQDLENSRRKKHEKRGDQKLADLSQLSVNAEALTGEDAGFGREVNLTHGGINVLGAVSASTFTLKSLLSSHCGVNPLPVDFLEETETEIYQPCLPQILKVMNSQRTSESSKSKTSWKEAPWKSMFMQASTSQLDRQTEFMEQMGFDQSIDREIMRDASSEFGVNGPELNYFGYSERELRPHIRKALLDAEEKGERLFLSHLTSSTHHPWATPEEFGDQESYWGDSRGGNSPWNRYLNTIKFADQWVGEVLELVQELGIADKTLVVVLGDHGFSFGDATSTMTTTYANSHISSFPIPITFHHPLLPRASVNATITPLSIVPTILDLLASTGSLEKTDEGIARDLIPEYEGQTLIRDFVTSRDGREAWNFGLVNPGGTHLSVMSAAHPYRYVLPICEPTTFSFSQLQLDPTEAKAVKDWEGGHKIVEKVRKAYGDEAAEWAHQAEKIGRWYVWEARRRWGYWSGTRREDRGVGHLEDGHLKHDHWWIT